MRISKVVYNDVVGKFSVLVPTFLSAPNFVLYADTVYMLIF